MILLLISLRPFEQHRVKYLGEEEYLLGHGSKRVMARKDADRNAVISSRSQMIEVCSESSFQPILQLYLFLPTLIMSLSQTENSAFNTDQSVGEWFTNVSNLQLWSILTSCFSLSWSFNFHQSVKKKGALGFGMNPVGRILLLLSNILQISARLLAFVLFAYCCGDGNFWPMFVGVVSHIGLMSVIYFHQTKGELTSQNQSSFQSLYQSIVNGVGNLYLWNLILPVPGTGNQTKNHTKESFLHQAIVDSICILENLVIVIIAFFQLDDLPAELLMYSIGGHLLGLLLKCAYYYQFHIWSPVLEVKNP